MSEKAKSVKLEGVTTFKVSEKVSEWVLGCGAITINKLTQFVKEHPEYLTEYNGEKQIKFKILKGDYGLYFVVDTYGLDKKQKEIEHEKHRDYDDIPF